MSHSSSNQRESHSAPEGRAEQVAHLPVTRVAFAALLAITALCAAAPLVQSIVTLMTVSPPPTEFENSNLFPAELSSTFSVMYRDQIISCLFGIVSGLLLSSLVVLAFIYRTSLLCVIANTSHGRGWNTPFRRLALFGFATACLAVVAAETYPGIRSSVIQITAIHILNLVVLLAFAASVLAGTIGRDLRIRIRDGLAPYAFAVLGAVCSVGPTMLIITRPIKHLWWQWQNGLF